MNRFIFDKYYFDEQELTAYFNYKFENGDEFVESVVFEAEPEYDNSVLDRALFLAFIIIGTSYYKAFPSVEVVINQPIDEWQKYFFDSVYQEGLSQYAYENNLRRDDLANFVQDKDLNLEILPKYNGMGVLVLQSGGKDSLLVAALLNKKNSIYIPWYLSGGDSHPSILDRLGQKLSIAKRSIDKDSLAVVSQKGAKNGHVPVTYINQSIAIIQAVLLNKSTIISSIAHEGEEPYTTIGDLDVMHQWSKTWRAEQSIAEYVRRYISEDIKIGSPIRDLSELRVAELFVHNAWDDYGHDFSSCNVANYKQGSDNSELKWCGDCSKCANSYLLFAPFLPANELRSIFNGQDLFEKISLSDTFMSLLGLGDSIRPFECIGEVDELRLAYHMSQSRGGYASLPFEVPDSSFDYKKKYQSQGWATEMLQ